MANALIILPDQYLQGVVTLYRGDQWNLNFQLVNQVGGVNVAADMTAASGVTGFFPAATGGVLGIPCTAIDVGHGFYRCVVPSNLSSDAALASDASSWYAQALTPNGLQTFATPDMPLVINDPMFQT